MESILENIISRIGEGMPELKTVDEDYGQLEFIDQESRDTYPLTFPAVLIDAPDTQWSNMQGLSQKGTATVRARLIIDCYDDTHYTSGTTAKISEREGLRRKLHLLLQGYRPGEGCAALVRTSSRFYTFNHGLKVYEATYTATITEIIEPDTVTISRPAFIISTGK